jgi:hypothetical protein
MTSRTGSSRPSQNQPGLWSWPHLSCFLDLLVLSPFLYHHLKLVLLVVPLSLHGPLL